jgi:sorbose reductase
MTNQSIKRPNPPLPDSVFAMFSMKGRVAIITGGSGGIGYEVARALAEAGADIALWYNSSPAEKLAETLVKDFGVRAKAYKVAVQVFEQVQAAINAVVADFGGLDVMIANAGIPSKAGGLDDRLEDWHRVVDVDFSGAYYCARVAGEIFRKQGHGNLIFTASMSGHAVNVPQQQVCILFVSSWPELLRCSQFLLGLLQRLQSGHYPPRQIARRRMGRLCPGQQRQSWVYRHGH